MSRDYRVMKKDKELAIYQVFLNNEGRVQRYSANPSFPRGGDLEALLDDLKRYNDALLKPILDQDNP